MSETNSILEKVGNEAKQKSSKTFTAATISRLDAFDFFLPEHVLLKIVSNLSRILRLRTRKETDTFEFKGVLVLHILAASYKYTVDTIKKKRNHQFFVHMKIPSTRYSQIWSALPCTPDRLQRVQNVDAGWFNYLRRANALITELEVELASVNRLLLYIPGVAIFCLDDDHQRIRSRAVAQMTTLSHVNNPQKALGPVHKAMCSALTHVFLASHYLQQGQTVIDVWERLIRLIKGVPTAGFVRPMVDAIFASDRGYNSKATVEYINEGVGATGIGTHKRSLDYPFVFGDGPIRKNHKGRVVSQRGCRAIYSASRKPGTIAGRIVEAIVFRESLGGRIAALYLKNDGLFSANRFTLIPKPSYETTKGAVEREIFHFVFDDSVSKATESRNCEYDVTDSFPRLKVGQVLSNVDEVTLLQSEDPDWFLGRAFQFTSRTSQAFIRALCEDYENNVEALSFLVCGKESTIAMYRFPSVRQRLRIAWYRN